MHKPLFPSTKDKRASLVASCSKCVACSSQFCFSLAKDKSVAVEKVGECPGDLNLQNVKLKLAKEYAKHSSPMKALDLMLAAGVPPEHRPDSDQIRNQRPCQKKDKTVGYSVDCLGALRKFVESPPEGVHVYKEHVTISEEQVRIPFECSVMDTWFESCELHNLLCDFTFKTNRENLVLGGVGPVGLRVGSHAPSMRFAPVTFLLAESEDGPAIGLLVRLFLDKAARHGKVYTDAFLDCRCLSGIAAELQRASEKMYLHRCLQHVKANVRLEAGRRDPITGKARLANTELVDVIIGWIEFSASLPSDSEFSCFWQSILQRMSKKCLVIKVLMKCILLRIDHCCQPLRWPVDVACAWMLFLSVPY